MPDYKTLMIDLWQSACQDKPKRPSAQVLDGYFVLTINGNRGAWADIVQAAGVPAHATQVIEGDTLTARWPSVGDAIFGPGGDIAQRLPGYECRAPQLHMARLIQRSIEMGTPAVVEAGTGTGKCLHPDTLISMSDGTLRRIADLVGQHPNVVSLGSGLLLSHGSVARCWASGEKQTYRMVTRLGREIKASQDHRFLTVTGWKRLEELVPGDRIASPRRLPAPVQSCSMPEHEIVFLAHMITDGTCSAAGYRGAVTYTKSDSALVEDVRIAANAMGCTLVRRGKYGYGICRQKQGRSGRNVAILLLEQHGLTAKDSYGKFVPDAIFRLPDRELALFLGRLFSGDGSVDADRSVVEYSTVSRRLAEQVQHLLLRFGIVASLSLKNGRYLGQRHVSWRLTVSGKQNVEAFNEHLGPFVVGDKAKRLMAATRRLMRTKSNPNYDVIPREIMPAVMDALTATGLNDAALRREGIRIRLGHKGISRRNMRTIGTITNSPLLACLSRSDIYWDEIIAIEPAEFTQTYDIEMVGEPNFVADDFIVHNSYSYAAVCMAMNKKVIISTSNKALQMQLIDKDLPFLQRIWPDKRVAVSVGKGNYACRLKCDHMGESGANIADPDLYDWYANTATGNTEEILFAVDFKALKPITVDDDCAGRHCPLYADCFYYRARAALQGADVVVTNHALLCLDQVAEGNILPPADVVVVDEAHKLADYMRSARGCEISVPQVLRAIGLAEGYADPDKVSDAEDALLLLERGIAVHTNNTDDAQVSIGKDEPLQGADTLALQLLALAEDVRPEDELPADADEKKLARKAQRICTMAGKLAMMSGPTRDGYVRWIDQGRGGEPAKLCSQPFDVSHWIAQLAGVNAQPAAVQPDYTRCERCRRTLTAEKVAILDRKPYGPDCIHHVDVFGDAETVNLAEWLALDRSETPLLTYSAKATIFCSATLAAPDMAHFLRTAGLPQALQMQAASPFDYAANALLYLPSGAAPAPNAQGWLAWAVDEMRQLVLAANGGAFLLFTSYSAMNTAVQTLARTFTARGLTVLVQGEMPKAEIAKRFKADGSAVLFATKSFFEGVSIDGAALRLVVVDKMPFEAPTPLTQAMEADLLDKARAAGLTGKTLEMYPFNALRVPRMIIELKQGLGRLIRTQTDQGVMAVLDSRIRSAQYGRSAVIPSLPPAALCSRIELVQAFYGTLPPLPAKLLAPPAEVREEKAATKAKRAAAVMPNYIALSGEEIPF
jgi:Rad3-related DNA helicase/intein/homing endonuclease